ncbi:RagB/SusD family nutrient uptake outer membrane protein [Bacteroides thetaiotaomicron]|nr:RagB/SusD family nutrient uptake outer membrane protein [Bacteroides thetaiotaomicron]
MRAGVPDFDNNIYADKDVFHIYLKRERQIKLMGEGKCYYDIDR